MSLDPNLMYLGEIPIQETQAQDVLDPDTGEYDNRDVTFTWHQAWYIHKDTGQYYAFDGWGVLPAYEKPPAEIRQAAENLKKEGNK